LYLIVKRDVDYGSRWHGAVQGLKNMLNHKPAIRSPEMFLGCSRMRELAPDKKQNLDNWSSAVKFCFEFCVRDEERKELELRLLDAGKAKST
jgi:hypothetical protein